MRAPGVELRDLSRWFGDQRAVDRLRFTVERGELFGIVGPDGAGKTTLLRMLAGVLRPTSGDAVVGGISVAAQPEAVKSRIAYMSQRFGLYADLTVQENLAFYADLHRVPKQARPARLDRLYEFSALRPFADRLAGNLSGGMKQKLSLSCALIHDPEVLLLDEPTFGVDPISRRDLWLIVHEMVARGTTALVTTAYMDEAERCDRVALLHEGRLIGLAAPRALQAELVGRVFSFSSPRPRRAAEMLRGQPEVRNAVLFGDSIHVTVDGGDAVWRRLRDALRRQGVSVTEAGPVEEPSLEDVFIERVRSSTRAGGPGDERA